MSYSSDEGAPKSKSPVKNVKGVRSSVMVKPGSALGSKVPGSRASVK